MPKSIISPDTVFYPEDFSINKEDLSTNSKLYEINIRDVMAIIAIGSPIYKFKDFDIVYFPIYLMKTNKHFFTIGLYELYIPTMDPLKPAIDELLQSHNALPIIYQSVTSSVITKLGMPKTMLIDENNETNNNETNKAETNITINNNDDDQLQKHITRTSSWISEFVNTPGFKKVTNEGGGDCLFAVLRDGLKSVGVQKSILELRELLSDSITDDIFKMHKLNYDAHNMEINELTQQKSDLKEQMVQIKNKAKTIPKSERDYLVKQMNTIKQQAININNSLKIANQAFKVEFGYMKNVSNMNDMKKAVKKSSFWADDWAISTMEKILNIKLIIMMRHNYEDGQLNNVIACGNSINTSTFEPTVYIITDYSGNHYELITYNNKGALTFNELPKKLVIKISQDCLKGESGAYNIISDFNRLKSAV